jgi:hypothetical protein
MGKLRLIAVLGVLLGTFSSAHADMLAPGTPLTDDFVLGPTTPGKWGGPVMGTPGGIVTWSLMNSGIAVEDGGLGGVSTALSAFMPAGFLTQIQNAFAAWSAVANIQFVQVADNGLPFDAPGATGMIRIAGTNLGGPGGVLAHGYYPPINGNTAAGDIHFDVNDTWKIGFGAAPGFDIFQVMAHEIGHAIGLDHTGVANSLMNPNYTEAFSGPQADDIAGAQFIYGAAPQGEIPEPASMVLFALGAVALPFARRRLNPTTVA